MIANSDVLDLLNQIDKLYDLSLDKSSLMLREMASNIITNNQERINNQRQEVEFLGAEIKRLHEKLVFEIRQELNEI